MIRVTPNDGSNDGESVTSDAFLVDNLAPDGTNSFGVGTTGITTMQLLWGAPTENHFGHYEIWYGTSQTDVENRNGTALEWDDLNDENLLSLETTSTTVTGLAPETVYFFRIWAVDAFGNEEYGGEVGVITNVDNTRPGASVPGYLGQATNGSGYVNFVVDLADADNNSLKLKVEYSDNDGENWHDPDLVSVTASTGSPDLNNAENYQIGSNTPISTLAANTLIITWDTKSSDNGNGSLDDTALESVRVRVTPNDSLMDGESQISLNFPYDNVDPNGLTALNIESRNYASETLSWAAVSELNFNHYEIWYGREEADVQGRNGEAEEWDGEDDSDLDTISTAGTRVTGLRSNVTYYFKIWAVDNAGNFETVDAVSGKTKTRSSHSFNSEQKAPQPITLPVLPTAPTVPGTDQPTSTPSNEIPNTPGPINAPVLTVPTTNTPQNQNKEPEPKSNIDQQTESNIPVMPEKRNILKEVQGVKDFIMVTGDLPDTKVEWDIVHFLSYGGNEIYNEMSEKERQTLVRDFKDIYGYLPANEKDWNSLVKTSEGETPKRVISREKIALEAFTRIFGRVVNYKEKQEERFIHIIAYRLHIAPRDLKKEVQALKRYIGVYSQIPGTADDWSILKAIAYTTIK